ncbi:MAG: vancomycin resistance protein VanW [Crocinitomicaceae bacterium]|jgi:vancomycin resistance protein VanW
MNEIKKPINRSRLRQVVGREYYILKRKYDWVFGDKKWAKEKGELVSHPKTIGFKVHQHRSMILRPLKDVDMYLQENKRRNLELAIEHLNRIIIRPGETFSIWKLVGRPTKNKGYLEGLVLKQGTIDKDIGGGLCQLGNLLFWVFAHSPLTIKERYRHGFDVFPDVNRKVPFGAGATLSYNHIDLQVKNETENTFQINLWMDNTHLHGALVSCEKVEAEFRVEERNHIIKQQFWGGYSRHNQIVQVRENYDGAIEEKVLVENHAVLMYSPFLEEAKV